jgi:hypothetical protein
MKVPNALLALGLMAAISPVDTLSFAQTAALKPATPIAASAPTAVPALVPYSGLVIAGDGKTFAAESGVTFQIYKDEVGGEALWTETQTVAIDSTGRYKVQLGATNPNGLPADLFASGEARWLEVQVAGEAPQPRVLLVSVPYALKAADAATLGGLPPSAFALARPASEASAAVSPAITPNLTSNVTTTGGTLGFVPEFSGTSSVVDSPIFVNPTGEVGIGTATPDATLDVNGSMAVNGMSTLNGVLELSASGIATASTGFNSQVFKLYASAYNSSSATAVSPHFEWVAKPTGNDTATPGGTLNLLASPNSSTAVDTGLHLNTNGTITFAPGQTFPGTGAGTITGVTAGTDLTGGGTTGNVTLNLNTTKVPLLAANNTFTGLQTVNASSGSAGITVKNSDASAGFGLEASAYVGIKSTGTTYGIQGVTTSGEAGIYGSIQGGNTHGGGGFVGNAGVWGDTGGGPGTYIGVLGTADDTAGGVFDNNSQGNFYASLFAQNDTASNPSAAVISTLGTTYDGICNIDVSGNLSCSGTISGSNVAADRRVLRTYAVQAAENWYEDAGSGQLQSGSARVALEANFAAVVNSDMDYHVFLTPNGDCKGLYVSNKTATGFEVRELGGGASNVAFDYRIMVKRRGFEKLRMDDVTLQERKQAEQRPNFRRRVATGASVSPAP